MAKNVEDMTRLELAEEVELIAMHGAFGERARKVVAMHNQRNAEFDARVEHYLSRGEDHHTAYTWAAEEVR